MHPAVLTLRLSVLAVKSKPHHKMLFLLLLFSEKDQPDEK